MAKEHKTFCVEGQFLPITSAMKKRGWLEKRTQSSKDKNLAVTSRVLQNISVDFLWTWMPGTNNINNTDFSKHRIVNRFSGTRFNTKDGLCSCLKQLHWCYKEGVADTLFPRCYSIYNTEELAAFKEDFRMTACISLLKWIVESYEKNGEEALSSAEGKIPVTAVGFAVSRCNEYISIQLHEDIDSDVYGQEWGHQWDQFLTWYYMAVHNNEKFAETTEHSILMLYNLASSTLSKMEKYWTQMHLDGTRNIWIIKPGANSRGRGIQLMDRLEKVMAIVNLAVTTEKRYVVQKYIERPFLIYDTKFDIRQWFLVTCVQPMTIWMYRESYLRFCSQCFDLLNFHESVHLSNNAVQSKYKNGKRDPKLPDENMWDCHTFQTYLRTLGKAEMWSQRIYPGMRQSIIGSLLASQENIDRNNNCFELFGADFILDEAFKPWLIEINSCPSTIGTTSVTARMTAQCLEDVIKVVIDRRTDRKADTGMFELIFKQHIPPAPPYHSVSLSVRGQKMCKEDITKLESFLCSTAIFSCDDASHENKSEEAAENEQTSKVTSEKNAAHVTTQKILKNTDNKCNTVRHTNGSTSNRIFDDQNRTATSPLQLAQKPRHYFQHCQKINLNSNVETKFVITKQLSSPEKLINKGISPTYFNTIGASPKHGNKTKILPTHMNKNETSATRINNNGTLSTQLNKNGTSLTRFNEIGTSPTHFNKNETSHTHFNENETSPEVFNKTEISPIHTKETGSSPPTYNNKDGRSPIHKKYGEDKEIKHAEVIKEKIMWRSQEQANVITETREAMPVRKVLQEVARKNEKIMDKKVKHLSNTNFVGKNILEKNTSVGGAANLPTQYHKQAENTTTMQTKLQLYTISENTEENSMDKLWVRDVEKEDRHLSDEDSQIKKHNSNTWKNSGSALRATEVYNQWIQKLAQTKLSYEKLLNTLQIFKESENTTKNTKNSSSEKLPFTWNNGLSHRQVIKNILKRYHTDQELPDFELRGSQVSTEDICSDMYRY